MLLGRVIAGDYEKCTVEKYPTGISIVDLSDNFYAINKDTIEKYEVIDEKTQRDAGSVIARGLIGGMIFGGAGLLLGGLSGKSKKQYYVALQFKNNKKSLLELNESSYTELLKVLF
jgi:hypothetical protein